MDQNTVVFRYSTTEITETNPSLLPGAFTFDSESLALYIDTDTKRVQVRDPLKLSLTGGNLTGDLNVLDSDGTISASISTEGIINGQFIETTGNISLDTAPDLYAVIDATGRIRTRTKAQMIQDLDIANIGSLGKLAYVDYVIGDYTPEGTISAPEVIINSDTESVVKSIIPGNPASFSVDNEVLSLVAGTETTSTNIAVMKSVSSVNVTPPIFTGKKSLLKLEAEST